MSKNEQIDQSTMLGRLHVGQVLLAPLVIRELFLEPVRPVARDQSDARLGLELPDTDGCFWFVLESKSRSTPQAIQFAIAQARGASSPEERPMIQVPYLSPERLEELERERVSGVDLCGNGVVIVPGRLWVKRSGQPNLYPDSRPLNNPYRGRSAVVARMLLMQPRWESLTGLAAGIRDAGTSLSLPQVSKAVQALAEELVVLKSRGTIMLTEPLRVLDQLAREWKRPPIRNRQSLRLAPRDNWQQRLSLNSQLRWAVTGESSVSRYATFAQGGPRRIAVSSLSLAQSSLKGIPESVPSFADIELLETTEEGFFFANEIEAHGIRWANIVQTWLELRSGDARQQEAANDLQGLILRGLSQ